MIEVATVLLLLGIIAVSYLIVSGHDARDTLLTPPLVAGLLVANLFPATALMVLAARRLALRRGAASAMAGKNRLHVRLVALFSVIATVPTLLVVIFASLLFQYGVEFWSSDRAHGMLENAASLARENYQEELNRVGLETQTMSGDLASYLREVPLESSLFAEGFASQVYRRNLSESIILQTGPNGEINSLALVNPYDRPLTRAATPEMIAAVRAGRTFVVTRSADRIAALTRLNYQPNTFLYAARVFQPALVQSMRRGDAVLADYRELLSRSRSLQLRFNIALLGLSLLLVGVCIWIALRVADRLVRPIGHLALAAQQVTEGDLSARVPDSPERDEIGTLGNAFNRMTSRLEEQTGALVTANAQLDSRRAFTEAVLSGVTAGVMSVGDDHVVRLTNRSAEALLRTGETSPVGQRLADLSPELDRQLTANEREDVVQLASRGEPRTLAVKTVKVEGGYVLTFDDITEQLMDQRRAAWSDVARRIAHEIKNPLTPIQLAAERLQRRYGREVTSDPATFDKLTGTIVRQVGDLRRMVDEFSSFARMPKPAFALESLGEIAREALFLHEVAHPDIAFSLDAPEPAPMLVCDRRLLGQALTNVVKNAVEAIQQRREEGGPAKSGEDKVAIVIRQEGDKVAIEVSDTGIGLPSERARITEPYMTTRAKGTGLGLAIVKKIIEEHFGQIAFADAPGGGSTVRMIFEPETLAQLVGTTGRVREDISGIG